MDKLFIKLTQNNINFADAPADAPLSFSCPKIIGLNTTNTNMTFKNSTGGSFVNLLNDVQVEIISIGATIKGKVKGASLTENCTVNGIFEVPLCQ